MKMSLQSFIKSMSTYLDHVVLPLVDFSSIRNSSHVVPHEFLSITVGDILLRLSPLIFHRNGVFFVSTLSRLPSHCN